jgi:hypothetical protein
MNIYSYYYETENFVNISIQQFMKVFKESESLQIEEKSIHPALKLKVNYEFERGILPISFDGAVYTHSQKFIKVT